MESNDSMYYWLWGILGIAELNGGILFGIGQKFNKKLENISFGIALVSIIVYIVFWIMFEIQHFKFNSFIANHQIFNYLTFVELTLSKDK